jgi:hypothetical protein
VTAIANEPVTAGMSLSRNARTALILATVALAFFVGIILKYWLIR